MTQINKLINLKKKKKDLYILVGFVNEIVAESPAIASRAGEQFFPAVKWDNLIKYKAVAFIGKQKMHADLLCQFDYQ